MLVADGARPDTLAAGMDTGLLPALARLRTEGGFHVVTSVFPSVTGPAYAPFLMGRFPGPIGLPGLRWYDRSRTVTSFPHWSRSYVGSELRKVDRDLEPGAPTLFELTDSGLAAMNVIGRGLDAQELEGHSLAFAVRAAYTHFRGDLQGWLAIDRAIGERVASRIRRERPEVAFCAFICTDKLSHAVGQGAAIVSEALRIVDQTAAQIRDDAERDGCWERLSLWVVSDHGHSSVREHEDLVGLLQSWKLGVIAHPWVFGAGRDAAVMVSGNAMAHVYLDLDAGNGHRGRPWWGSLAERWSWLPERLLERRSVDLLVLPLSPQECEVRARGRGAARVIVQAGRYSYRPISGDPLGIGAHEALAGAEAHAVTGASDYPDALVQIAHLAGSTRAGEIILSAAREWDFRARWEPIRHVSSHGALHRDHMLVPLLLNRPAARIPHRTVDVMPSALSALGRAVPAGLDGVSFV
ncbi:MAG TPA: alkaline phosphatase family protein [Gemmatimonadaceae bacterium]|nr:alkaline phosphatase family protein [Gemmatimonadaceae bacterium]